MLVRDIGEQGLLTRLFKFCPSHLVGDDAAVLALSAHPFPPTFSPAAAASISTASSFSQRQPYSSSLVVTTDVLVDGVHFSLGLGNSQGATMGPADVGWRSAAANLSDLAAMGALPIGMTVGLSLPDITPIAWVEDIYQGMVDCLSPFETPIIGGDLCRSPVLALAITALGLVDPQQVWQRSTAQPGDAILVTGCHGASRAGLELLLHPEAENLTQNLPETERQSFILAHQRPQPRLDVVSFLRHRLLQASVPLEQARAGVPGTVMERMAMERMPMERMAMERITAMDSSDGLADAVLQICRASGVGAELWRDRLPMPSAFSDWLSPAQAIDWTLYGGEDFELVLCLPLEQAIALQAALGGGAAIVGTITANLGVRLTDPTATYPDQDLSLNQGFQHF